MIPVRWSSSKIDTFTRYGHYLLLTAIAIRIAVCVADGGLIYEEYSGTLTSFSHDISRNVVKIEIGKSKIL